MHREGSVRLPADAGHGVVKIVFCPVHGRVLRQGDGIGKGTQNARGGYQKSKIPLRAGFYLFQLLVVDHPESRDAVVQAPLIKFFQALAFLIPEADDQLSAAPEGYVQLRRHGLEFRVALHGADRPEGAFFMEDTGVQQSGIPPAGAVAHVQLLFQHADGELISGKLPGYGAANDAAADNHHIIICFHSVIPASPSYFRSGWRPWGKWPPQASFRGTFP